MDADPATRNILGVASVNPELAAGGIRIRQVGQQIIETLADKRIHPGWVVGGGVNKPLSKEDRDKLSALIPQAMTAAESALKWFIAQLDRFSEEIANFCNFPTLYLALAGPNNELETYDGLLRVVDDDGRDVVGKVQPKDFATIIDEEISPHSYLKSPYFKPLGISAGVYRVGPLARMHMASTCGTPRADEALKEFQHLDHRSSFYYHYARLIEIIYAFEMIQRLLDDAEILDEHVRAFASPNAFEGIGVAEAPRGTLMHHYKIDENGLITYADLVIATGHNNLAMNMGITQAAKHFIKGENISEGILNRIEAVIRTFDPCLSCSTHAFGQMPLHIQLLASDGSVLDEVKR
jgi:NAD-reducing hydrogenase large subunit